ncbi:MAG: bifunctional riboflavin kinase/FAD synthetase [Actinobacteria bacterium]|nr:bifunctional riboflavin kinase/FAD synthetase [Actinomycetota bacterium]
MKLLDSSGQFKPFAERSIVAIGVFDGVHRGHQEIISEAVRKAAMHRVPSVVLTFKRNPREVISGSHPCVVSPQSRKAKIIEDLRVDCMISVEFSEEFASLEPEQFCGSVLGGDLGALWVCVGEDFRFGKNGTGDVNTLAREGKKLGFEVDVVPLIYFEKEKLSSTVLRKLIKEGRVVEVGKGLGRPLMLTGHIIHGHSRGRRLGFPTANLSLEIDFCVPADGVYAGLACLEQEKYICAINIGDNPTFGDGVKALEVYLLDFDGRIYGETLEVEFHYRLRDEVSFENESQLIGQMQEDVKRTRDLLQGVGEKKTGVY